MKKLSDLVKKKSAIFLGVGRDSLSPLPTLIILQNKTENPSKDALGKTDKRLD